MAKSTFVYVTYIRTTPAKLWDALTKPEFIRRYWFGMTQESEWKRNSPWRLLFADGRPADGGEILEAVPQKRLVIKWRNEWKPELKADGYTRCTFTLERENDQTVKLTVVHEAKRGHKLIRAVSKGWPQVLSSLKSLLETGKSLPQAAHTEKQARAG